jgi:RNA polymerase sigma-70 factor (ECF subfamily)
VTEDDAVLIERARSDPEAFGDLYERYVGRIYSYIYHRTGNAADAEDLAERVFLQALTHLPNYTYRGLPFSVWLFRIAHNLVANWYRDRGRARTVSLDGVMAMAHDVDRMEQVEEATVVRRVVARLAPDRQQLLLLKFGQELSHAEIGQIMGRSEGAVKALLHRTLKAMKEELKDSAHAGQHSQKIG